MRPPLSTNIVPAVITTVFDMFLYPNKTLQQTIQPSVYGATLCQSLTNISSAYNPGARTPHLAGLCVSEFPLLQHQNDPG